MKGQCRPYVEVPKLFLYACYFLLKIGFDRVTSTSREPKRGQNVLPIIIYNVIYTFLFPNSISGDSASFVIEMIMLIKYGNLDYMS